MGSAIDSGVHPLIRTSSNVPTNILMKPPIRIALALTSAFPWVGIQEWYDAFYDQNEAQSSTQVMPHRGTPELAIALSSSDT